MIIIGEKINSTSTTIRAAMDALDTAAIQELAKRQIEAGAHYIDINAGMYIENEPEMLEWLVKSIQEVHDIPMAIDSPNPKAIERALKAYKNSRPLINSITAETERFNSIVPLALEYNTGIVALCMDDAGMPGTADESLVIADRLITRLTKKGIAPEDIFIDPLARPIGAGPQFGSITLETVRKIKAAYPGVHITCGLSNISFGIPSRRLMNRTFLVAAIVAGMDSAIMDPLDRTLVALIYSAEALMGKDDLCAKYMAKYREGLFKNI